MILDKKTRFVKPRDPNKFYIDNKTLIPLLEDFKATGKISDELGKCFLLLAKKLATDRSFRNYTYVEDFIQDGVECCLKYAHNYNPEKGTNPFGYFSQIMKFSFVNRIKQEGHYHKVKKKAQEYDENGYLFLDGIVVNSLDKSDQEEGNLFPTIIEPLLKEILEKDKEEDFLF